MMARDDLPEDVQSVWDQQIELLGDQSAGVELESYCGQIARLRDAQRRLGAEGSVIADAKGNPIPHPALAIERVAQAEIRSWSAWANKQIRQRAQL